MAINKDFPSTSVSVSRQLDFPKAERFPSAEFGIHAEGHSDVPKKQGHSSTVPLIPFMFFSRFFSLLLIVTFRVSGM